ncbi:MAG: ROK family transcriptional regulator [Actinobacteria bacterium]|nr:ROK family transcriptional regulator [Actinomycetota bacterium]
MRQNLAVVLRQLHGTGAASRADLARATGLTKATVSALVGELSDLGLVREVDGAVGGRTGRPATLVSVSGERAAAIGLEVNVGYLAIATVDLEGRVAHERLVEIDRDRATPGMVVTRLASLAARAVRALAVEGRRVIGTGLAVPGLVSQPEGRVLVAPNFGWSDLPLTEMLRDRFRRRSIEAGPVATDNEATMAALAHVATMRAREVDSFLAVSGGVGVGAGVVIDGEAFRGSHGFGGELGHFVVDPGGRRCRCGNRGCLETIAGESNLLRAAGVRRGAGGTGLDRIEQRARRGDPRTVDGLEHVGEALSLGLAAAANLFDPQAIVLGGSFAPLAPWLAPVIERRLADQVLGHRWAPIPVVTSSLGRAAAVHGAAQRALTSLLADPSIVARRSRGGDDA